VNSLVGENYQGTAAARSPRNTSACGSTAPIATCFTIARIRAPVFSSDLRTIQQIWGAAKMSLSISQ